MDKSSNPSSTPPPHNTTTSLADNNNNNSNTTTTATAAAAAAAENNNNNNNSNNNNNNNSTTDHYLKHLNKLSHKITKQQPKKLSDYQTTSSHQNPPPPPQPPVYNINKSDFRDVVQKLTGSPAHHSFSTAPPPKNTTSSRLQKIRPPPLPQLRPPTADPRHQPLSPLPPFPSVHTAAESPISAYMRRFIEGSDLNNNVRMEDWKRRWNHHNPNLIETTTPQENVPPFPMPSSPLGFGCLASPKPLFPLSPNVQHSSPRNVVRGFRRSTHTIPSRLSQLRKE